MSKRDIGLEILEGIEDIKAHEAGVKVLCSHGLKVIAAPKEIHSKLNLSQAAFEGLIGVSLRTVQDWEKGRRKPSGLAEALLRIVEKKPEVFTQIL
ncbi:MAG: helix-turn-helix domain-containing protein [Anaerolineales bacterium]|jgi:putative transcriptional regulator